MNLNGKGLAGPKQLEGNENFSLFGLKMSDTLERVDMAARSLLFENIGKI